MAAHLELRCDRSHTHTQLGGARTAEAVIDPNKLVEAICTGIEEQNRADRYDANIIARIEYIKGSNVLAEVERARANAAKCHEEVDFSEYAIDDVSGDPLDPNEVRKARMDKLK